MTIKMTKQDGTIIEVSDEDAAKLLKGYEALSMLDATVHSEAVDRAHIRSVDVVHMRRAAFARGFPMGGHTFDEWLAFKPELFPEEWRTNERWLAVIRNNWAMGAAEGNPRQIMDEETFVKRLADAMRLPPQGPY